jgi:hypothetical protein
MTFTAQRLLDTTPRWLSITLISTSSALVITGVGFVLSLFDPFNITPFTLLLHLVWAIVVSSWVLNLKVKLPSERKALLAMGVAVAVGSVWGAVQQWLAYLEGGIVNDITLVVAAVALDAVGGLMVYILYHLNILGRKMGPSGSQSGPASPHASPSP